VNLNKSLKDFLDRKVTVMVIPAAAFKPWRWQFTTAFGLKLLPIDRLPHQRFDGWAPVRSGHSYRANAVAGRTPAALPDEASRDERPQLCLRKRRALHAAAPPPWIRRGAGREPGARALRPAFAQIGARLREGSG